MSVDRFVDVDELKYELRGRDDISDEMYEKLVEIIDDLSECYDDFPRRW